MKRDAYITREALEKLVFTVCAGAVAIRSPDNRGSAYNRTKFIRERRVMMQLWADYLDKLNAGARTIRIGRSNRSANNAAPKS